MIALYMYALFLALFIVSSFVVVNFRSNVDKREALENLDLILLCLDEIVDGGYAYVSYLQCSILHKILIVF